MAYNLTDPGTVDTLTSEYSAAGEPAYKKKKTSFMATMAGIPGFSSGAPMQYGLGDISAAQTADTAAYKRSLAEMGLQQGYQTSEREASQAYGTSERLGSQAYGTGEREATQAYNKPFQEASLTGMYNGQSTLANKSYMATLAQIMSGQTGLQYDPTTGTMITSGTGGTSGTKTAAQAATDMGLSLQEFNTLAPLLQSGGIDLSSLGYSSTGGWAPGSVGANMGGGLASMLSGIKTTSSMPETQMKGLEARIANGDITPTSPEYATYNTMANKYYGTAAENGGKGYDYAKGLITKATEGAYAEPVSWSKPEISGLAKNGDGDINVETGGNKETIKTNLTDWATSNYGSLLTTEEISTIVNAIPSGNADGAISSISKKLYDKAVANYKTKTGKK